jgi:hypothetical protein
MPSPTSCSIISRSALLALLALLAPLTVAAQAGAPAGTIAPEEYAARRDAITPTGLEWLSRAPREPAEIESAMARRAR